MLDIVATVETEIPLTKKWSAREIEHYDNVSLIDLDKHLDKRGLRYLSAGRKIVSFILRRNLKNPKEEDVIAATSAINELFLNTCEHGEPPRVARLIDLGDVAYLDTANKKAEKDSEYCAGVGDLLIESRMGKVCVERVEEDGMCYTRIPIDLANPIKHDEIEKPAWHELE
jgi:hypothetical protein